MMLHVGGVVAVTFVYETVVVENDPCYLSVSMFFSDHSPILNLVPSLGYPPDNVVTVFLNTV